MDELPDLASDADVDALMTRLRARLEPPPQAALLQDTVPGEFAQAFDALVAAHEGLAASMVRAMEVIVETLEEFEVDLHPAPAPVPVPLPAPAAAAARKPAPRVRAVARQTRRPAARRRVKR